MDKKNIFNVFKGELNDLFNNDNINFINIAADFLNDKIVVNFNNDIFVETEKITKKTEINEMYYYVLSEYSRLISIDIDFHQNMLEEHKETSINILNSNFFDHEKKEVTKVFEGNLKLVPSDKQLDLCLKNKLLLSTLDIMDTIQSNKNNKKYINIKLSQIVRKIEGIEYKNLYKLSPTITILESDFPIFENLEKEEFLKIKVKQVTKNGVVTNIFKELVDL